VNSRLLTLIPTCVAINLAMGRVVQELGLPIYLDAVGTILVTALAGAVPGVVAGLLSQGLIALLSGQMMWLAFAPIQLIIVFVADVAAGRAGFRSAGRAALWGVLCGLAGGTVSAVISYILFKGVTATGVTALGAFLRSVGFPLERAVTIASLITDVADKAIAFALVAAVLLALPLRMAARFPQAGRATGRSR
jgi:energy-coupling factor transport system substrate-specific component